MLLDNLAGRDQTAATRSTAHAFSSSPQGLQREGHYNSSAVNSSEHNQSAAAELMEDRQPLNREENVHTRPTTVCALLRSVFPHLG